MTVLLGCVGGLAVAWWVQRTFAFAPKIEPTVLEHLRAVLKDEAA